MCQSKGCFCPGPRRQRTWTEPTLTPANEQHKRGLPGCSCDPLVSADHSLPQQNSANADKMTDFPPAMKYLTTGKGLGHRLAPGTTGQQPHPWHRAGVGEVALSHRGRTRGGTVHCAAPSPALGAWSCRPSGTEDAGAQHSGMPSEPSGTDTHPGATALSLTGSTLPLRALLTLVHPWR